MGQRHGMCRSLSGGLCLLAAFLFAGSAGAADSVVIHLANGDRLTGELVKEDSKRLVLRTPWKEQLEIPNDQIVRRELAAPASAMKPASTPAEPKPAAAATATQKPEPAVVGRSSPPPPPVISPKHWSGDLQFGLDLQKTAVDRSLYYTRLKLGHSVKRYRNALDFNYAYGRTDGIISANRAEGTLQSDVDVDKRLFVSLIGSGGYDQIRLVDLRYEVGPSLGYKVVTETNLVLNTGAGLSYQVQEFASGAESQLFYYRLAEDFSWKINKKLSLSEKFEFFPQVEHVEKFRFRAEGNLRYALLDNLFLNFTVLNLYDSSPAVGVGPNDLLIRSTIGVRF